MHTTIRDNYEPKIGDYYNQIIHDTVNNKIYLFDCDGVFLNVSRTWIRVKNELGDSDTDVISQRVVSEYLNDLKEELTTVGGAVESETAAREAADAEMAENLSQESEARQKADTELQEQIDAIVSSSDVKDIVGTYAELEAYPTATLGDNDIIKVLQDETHEGATVYYRWDGTQFNLVGELGPYYTKGEVDEKINEELGEKLEGQVVLHPITKRAGKVAGAYEYKVKDLATGQIISSEVGIPLASDTSIGGITAYEYVRFKAAADKIENLQPGGGGIEDLTSAYYDWPVENPDGIATWRLPAGIYTINTPGVRFYTSSDKRTSSFGGEVLNVSGLPSDAHDVRLYRANDNDTVYMTMGEGYLEKSGSILDATRTVNNLNSSSSTLPLAAGQGRELDLKIGRDLSTLATTDKSSLIAAINEVASKEGGGSSVDVVQTTGTSTTSVMSQKAVTDIVKSSNVALGTNSVAGTNAVAIGNGAYANTNTGVTIGASANNTGNQSVCLGYNTQCVWEKSISIGSASRANNAGSIAIGTGATTNADYSIALGPYSEANRKGELGLGCEDYYKTYGYKDTPYRLISGVHDPEDAHDAATKGYVDAAVAGAGGGGGGSSVDVVQSIGDSETAVMSQKAVTNMVFVSPEESTGTKSMAIGVGAKAQLSNGVCNISIGRSADASNNNTLAIGDSAKATGLSSTAIGVKASASGTRATALGMNANGNYFGAVAIGYQATTGQDYCVALGAGSTTVRRGEVSVGGSSLNENGYNFTNYRIISNVHDPQLDHDAATKGYVDQAVAGAGGGGSPVYHISSADVDPSSGAVHMWNKPAGFYVLDEMLTIAAYAGGRDLLLAGQPVLVINDSFYTTCLYQKANAEAITKLRARMDDGSRIGSATGVLLSSSEVIDTLSSTDTEKPLSAARGRYLSMQMANLEARIQALEENQ